MSIYSKKEKTRGKAPLQHLPEILEEGSVDGFERVPRGSVHRHVQLSDWIELSYALRELGVGDEERRDGALVQCSQHLVDTRVHYGLANEGEGAVAHCEGFLETLRLNTRHA
jgi:hypothetical protein